MKTNIFKLSLLGLLSVTCGLTLTTQAQNDPTNVAATKVLAKATGIQARNVISLAGKWRFEMDRKDVGKSDGWFKRELASTIQLPGSMAENQIGNPITETRPEQLVWHPRFKFDYRGAAWYQTTVTIPEDWQGKITELFLERVCWQSDLWVDEVAMGSCNSLTAPHKYEIGVLKPGAHRITLRLDNREIFYLGPNTHSYHEQSCTIFNGIIGRIELNARPAVIVRSCQVYPEATTGKCELRVTIANRTAATVSRKLSAEVYSWPASLGRLAKNARKVSLPPGDTEVKLSVEVPKKGRIARSMAPPHRSAG